MVSDWYHGKFSDSDTRDYHPERDKWSSGRNSDGDPTGFGGINPKIVLSAVAVIAIIAIVVAYWTEILLMGVAVLAYRYRKPLWRFLRRAADLRSHKQTARQAVIQASCERCHQPNVPRAPFCRYCGNRIASLPAIATAKPGPLPEVPATQPAVPVLFGQPGRIVVAPSPSTVPISRGVLQEIGGWRRAITDRHLIIDGQSYGIFGQQADLQHPGWTHYVLVDDRRGQYCGVSIKSDGERSALVVLEEEPAEAPAAHATTQHVATNTQIWLPARCGCTGQPFAYRCRFNGERWTILSACVVDEVPDKQPMRLADVHGVFEIADDFTGCPCCHDKTFRTCSCRYDDDTRDVAMSCNGMRRYNADDEEEHRCGHCREWHVCSTTDEFQLIGAEELPNQQRGLMKAYGRTR